VATNGRAAAKLMKWRHCLGQADEKRLPAIQQVEAGNSCPSRIRWQKCRSYQYLPVVCSPIEMPTKTLGIFEFLGSDHATQVFCKHEFVIE
jgi:hypothetical protein